MGGNGGAAGSPRPSMVWQGPGVPIIHSTIGGGCCVAQEQGTQQQRYTFSTSIVYFVAGSGIDCCGPKRLAMGLG